MDPFLHRLIQVSKVFSEQRERGEPVQNTQCVVIRVDFMIDQPTH